MLKLIPSAANRWVPCPGSAALEVPFPKGPTHPVTEEGKALHWAVDRVLGSWLPINTLDPLAMASFLGQSCPENGVVITEEMVIAGNGYLQNVWERAHSYLPGLASEKQLSAHSYIPKLAGRADTVWRSADGRWLSVWDLKFGYRSVAAFSNWQLISYALGAITPETETIELTVYQPRGASASQPVKTWIVSAVNFRDYIARIVGAAEAARGDNPPTVAGGWCHYCKAAATCETLRGSSFGIMDMSLRSVVVDLSEKQIAYELEMLDRAKSQLAARTYALDALAISRIQTGHPVPGFLYSKGMTNRQWTVPDEQVIAMGKLHGVELATQKPPTPNQAEVRGLPRRVIDMFTGRQDTAPKLTRQSPNEAREVFHK